MEYDRVLIEQSIAKQYGVLPSEQSELHYADWAKMVSGLMDDTPLGRVVQLRTERDKNVLRTLTPEQRESRAAWARFRQERAKKDAPAHPAGDMAQLEAMLAGLFGKR